MNSQHHFTLWTVAIVAAITLLPFLGLTDFTTKGEPREAVVAVSMLEQHNWILPVNNGVDIPYKPPFFQWCIAAISLPLGHVTEFTSRLPSALALIVMLMAGGLFNARKKNSQVGIVAATLTLTAFEVYRAGTNCRVDMMLTMFIVGALYAFYESFSPLFSPIASGLSAKGGKPRGRIKPGYLLLAILCMSGATLTKGPVGIVLPCFVMFVFLIVEACRQHTFSGRRLWKICYTLFLSALLACVLPALWYVAAYQQGGKEFLDLVLDENVGRFLGKMKIVTHENPWYYNILTLVSGWLPWTLLLVISLFFLPWRKFSRSSFMDSVRKADAVQVFTWLAFLLILFFYCIPKSKRSVYLLPCYPFMAALIAEYLVWLVRRSYRPVRIYIGILTAIGFLLTAVLVAVRSGAVPDTLFRGRHAYENIQMLHALGCNGLGLLDIVLVMLPVAASCIGLLCLLRRRVGCVTERPVLASITMMLLIYISFEGYYKPTVMNTKSLRPMAEKMQKLSKGAPMYAFTGINKHEVGDNTMHFFGADFYLNDRLRQFDIDRPQQGIVMVNAQNNNSLNESFSKQYSFRELYRSAHRETVFKDTIYIYQFKRH